MRDNTQLKSPVVIFESQYPQIPAWLTRSRAAPHDGQCAASLVTPPAPAVRTNVQYSENRRGDLSFPPTTRPCGSTTKSRALAQIRTVIDSYHASRSTLTSSVRSTLTASIRFFR